MTRFQCRLAAAPAAGSLRQPGFAQAICVPGEVLRTTKREIVLHTGSGAESPQLMKARGNLLSFLDPAGKRIACCGDVVCLRVVRAALQCFFSPHARLVVAPRA